MTVLHSGSNNKYSTNWGRAFAKGKSGSAKGAVPKGATKVAQKSGKKAGK